MAANRGGCDRPQNVIDRSAPATPSTIHRSRRVRNRLAGRGGRPSLTGGPEAVENRDASQFLGPARGGGLDGARYVLGCRLKPGARLHHLRRHPARYKLPASRSAVRVVVGELFVGRHHLHQGEHSVEEMLPTLQITRYVPGSEKETDSCRLEPLKGLVVAGVLSGPP